MRKTTPETSQPYRSEACVALVLGSILGITSGIQPAHAQPATRLMADTVFERKHLFSVGYAEQSAEATLRATIDERRSRGLTLKDLAIDNEDGTFFADYRYRFRPKWAVVASAYSFSGNGRRISERDFEFDGVEFTAGSDLRSTLEVDAYILDVLYQPFENERWSVWIGGGVHALDLGTNIRGEVRLNDDEVSFRAADSSLLAPVPNVRGMASWSLTERFGVRLTAGWLSANVDQYSGSFAYTHLRAFYAFGRNAGVSLGYQRTDVDITQDRSRGEIEFDVVLDGPTLTLNFGF